MYIFVKSNQQLTRNTYVHIMINMHTLNCRSMDYVFKMNITKKYLNVGAFQYRSYVGNVQVVYRGIGSSVGV